MTLLNPQTASAEIFFVEDQDDRFTVTFPDLWKKVGNQKPDDKLMVVGPGEHDFATCRIRVREERRFVKFPDKFSDSIQKIHVSHAFWDNYLGEYNDVAIDEFKDEAGLGRGNASMIEASFETAEGAIVRKRGIMFASLYHDQLYVADCSAEESVFDKWRPAFLGIIKSMNFDKIVFQNRNGHYRDFQNDIPVEVEGAKELDVYKF